MMRRLVVSLAAGLLTAGVVTVSHPGPSGGDAVGQVAPAVDPSPQYRVGDIVPSSAIVAAKTQDLPPLREQVARIGKADQIVVPRLGAALPVVKAPVRKGRVKTPPGVKRVGWVTSTRPLGSATGASWLVLHRDTGGAGHGVRSALYDIDTMRPGDVIRVRARGKTYTYRVTSVRLYSPKRLPSDLMSKTGPGRLYLSTCGGPRRLGTDGRTHWTRRAVVKSVRA